jgi:hypothetical protein
MARPTERYFIIIAFGPVKHKMYIIVIITFGSIIYNARAFNKGKNALKNVPQLYQKGWDKSHQGVK